MIRQAPFLLGLLLLAAPAAAQAPKKPDTPAAPAKPVKKESLQVTITAAKAEVPVGQLIKATVVLKNVGVDAVTLPKLAEDRQLVSFDVQLDKGKVFKFEKIHSSPYKLKKDWPVGKLEAGKTWTLEVGFPALTVGDFTITAHYGRKPASGLKNKPPHVTSKPVKVRIVADGKNKEVAVHFRTSMGPIRARLFPRLALGTCLHFARYILEGGYSQGDTKQKLRKPFHQGLIFHRVIRNFMIQTGCPLGKGSGDAGYGIPGEAPRKDATGKVPEKQRHHPGRLSMAKTTHPDSGGTQFFIVTGRARHLDGVHAVFGEVTRGMEVAYTISEVVTGSADKPLEDVTIDHIALKPAKGKKK